MIRVGIIDYGMGNLHSVRKAVEFCGGSVRIIRDYSGLRCVDKIILPGVGAFGDAIENLKKMKMYEFLQDYLNQDRLFLGICLGMQVLFESSQEDIGIKGFGFLKGRIVRFKSNKHIKIPHMGWNSLIFKKKDSPILKGLPEEAYVYFCHSYYPEPKEKEIVCATTFYGREFASVVQKSNIYGVQFHPEKSQSIGIKIIQNFLRL